MSSHIELVNEIIEEIESEGVMNCYVLEDIGVWNYLITISWHLTKIPTHVYFNSRIIDLHDPRVYAKFGYVESGNGFALWVETFDAE